MSTQIDYQIGLAPESNYGVAAAVSRFFESEVKFKYNPVKVQGKGTRPGKSVNRLQRNVLSRIEATGDMELEVPTVGFGILLKAVLGSVTSTQIGTSGVYQHVFTLAANDFLDSYTIQGVLPHLGGGTNPHTFTGCVAGSLDLDVTEGEILTAKIPWTAKDMNTSTAAVAASYPYFDLFTFVGGAISASAVDAVVAPTATALATQASTTPLAPNVLSASVSIGNDLDKGGYLLGGAGKRGRKNALGRRAITGKLKVEYTDNQLRDAFIQQKPVGLILTFTGPNQIGVDAGSNPLFPTLQIVIPSLLLKGDIPQSNGGAPIEIDADFEGFDNGSSAQPITVVYRSVETTP